MSKNKSRNVTLAGLTLGAVAIGAFAVVPAFGQSAVRVVNSIVTCASASACVDGRNTSTGQGVKGLSAKGTGVEGQTTFASSGTQFQGGVVGRDLSSTGTGDSGAFLLAAPACWVNQQVPPASWPPRLQTTASCR